MARMGDTGGACRVLVGKLRERGSLEDLSADETRIFKRTLMG